MSTAKKPRPDKTPAPAAKVGPCPHCGEAVEVESPHLSCTREGNPDA